MPRGSRPGERRGGRKKGVPNKLTSAAKEAFLAVFQRLAPDLETWIRQTAEGVEVIKTDKDGNPITFREGADPGKAADLTIKLAEYHYPKLGRTEVSGADGGPVIVELVKLDKPEDT